MEHLSSKTARQLKEYAEENGIDLGDAKTKTKILARIMDIEAGISQAEEYAETVIQAPSKTRVAPRSNAHANDEGVIAVHSAEKNYPPVKAEKKDPEVESGQVAVHSAKNLHWQGVGKLQPGYNILSKEVAAKWLTNKHVREATPEEVATYYGKA
jgi:hypothetical protein